MRKPWTQLAPYRLRLLFRGSFLFLALATVAMALYVLREEKQLSYHNYQQGFDKTAAQISAKLHHPAGQLALLNPPRVLGQDQTLRPLLLPFSALDFDDRYKVQQAVEMSGCLVQYPQGNICAAIGSNPWAGGFIYVAGSFMSSELQARPPKTRQVALAHRLRVQLSLRGQDYRWIAPFERTAPAGPGRLTGFWDHGEVLSPQRPLRDFRGWAWQDGHCLNGSPATPSCLRKTFFSVRLPVPLLRDALLQPSQPMWPPADLNTMAVAVQVLGPGQGVPLLDSNDTRAVPPFSLNELQTLLLPGETLQLRKQGVALLTLVGRENPGPAFSRLINSVVKRLSVQGYDAPLSRQEVINTALGPYELTLTGDVRSVNRSLSQAASRMAWFVGAMLLVIILAWLIMEASLIRRITTLTRRATALAATVQQGDALQSLDLSDLRSADELGVLAGCLNELLQQVQEGARREQIRAEQEKDLWHAVGHEIMSPLQSLMALAEADHESRRYINRMQQAIRVLYGQATPSEAFQATTLQLHALDLDAFLTQVAANATCVGLHQVRYLGPGEVVMVKADEYSLEDVITHVLRNADRYRHAGSPIVLTLSHNDGLVSLDIYNEGPPIPIELIDRIFEYGVSDQLEDGAQGSRGQGLFVAKTYMAKMGGTISVQNENGGVRFWLTLPQVSRPLSALA